MPTRVPDGTAGALNSPGGSTEDAAMPLAVNEMNVLAVVIEKGPIDAADCARLADMSPGITEATLRSLVNKGFAAANQVRRGLAKRPDGTYSATASGRAALAS